MAQQRPAAAERRHLFYSGHVQGVGFRYAVRQIAENYDVTGFVRNLPDRRVELVVEGSPGELEAMLSRVAERMADHIRHVTVDVRPANGEFSEFAII